MTAANPLDEAITRIELFQGLTDEERAMVVTVLRPRTYTRGEAVMREGDRAPSCMVLVAGSIGVFKAIAGGKDERLATLEPGALFGHVSLIDGAPRSATCRAETPRVVCLELMRDDFERLYNAGTGFAFKILDRIANDLVARMRGATEVLRKVNAQDKHAAQKAGEIVHGSSMRADLDDIDLNAITFVRRKGADYKR